MKINEREKKYLIALAITLALAGAWFAFKSMYLPYLDKMAELQMQIDDLSMQKQMAEARIAKLDQLVTAALTAQQEATQAVESFFPELPQDKVFLMVDELVDGAGLLALERQYSDDSLTQLQRAEPRERELAYFEGLTKRIVEGMSGDSRITDAESAASPSSAGTDDRQPLLVQTSNVTFSFVGDYDELLEYVVQTEAMNRTIAIDSLNLQRAVDGGAEGTLVMSMYAATKVTEDLSMEWIPEMPAGREDLFRQYYAAPVTAGTP